MPETQSQPTCPHCGYPIEVGEHALDCPNHKESSDKEEESFSEAEISEDTTKSPREVDAPAAENEPPALDRAKKHAQQMGRRLLKGARHLAEYGFLTYVSLVAIDEASKKTDMIPERITQESRKILERANEVAPFRIFEEARAGQESHYDRLEMDAEEQREFEQQLAEAEPDLSYLRNIYADNEFYNFMWHLEENFKRQTAESEVPDKEAIVGFEGTPYESAETSRLLSETYPAQWITNEIDSVIYKSDATMEERTSFDTYNLGEGWVTKGVARSKETGATAVDLYQHDNVYTLIETYSHEVGHVNDWERDNQLTAPERAELLASVTERFLSGENRYTTHYVESINNEDPSERLYNQVTEYWAEICGMYFSEPEWFAQEFPEDFALVDAQVKKQHPDFDPIAASQERDTMVDRMANERQEHAWAALPPEVRQEIEQMKQAEIENAFQEWQATGAEGISEEFIDRIEEITAAHNADFMLIYFPLAEEVHQASQERIAASLADFEKTLTDRDKEVLQILAGQVSAQLEDQEKWGDDILDKEIDRWKKQFAKQEYDSSMVKAYLFSVNPL